MENDQKKLELVEATFQECIELLKNAQPILAEVTFEGHPSLFKKSTLKRELEYILIDMHEYVDRINDREIRKIPKL
jgi:hypothetical protein